MSGILGIIPFFVLFLGTIGFGLFFEYCQESRQWSVYTIRQVAQYLGLGVTSIFLIACSFANDPYLAFSLVVLSQVMIVVVKERWIFPANSVSLVFLRSLTVRNYLCLY